MKHTNIVAVIIALFLFFGSLPPLLAGTGYDVMDLPVATDDEAFTLQNTWVTVAVTDNDEGSAIFLHTLPMLPANGTAEILPGKLYVRYTPNPGFVGTDVFTYTVKDFQGNIAGASVTVNVIPASQLAAINVAPTPVFNLEFCTQPLTPVIICEDWQDPNGDDWHISAELSNTTFHCSLVVLNDSCLRYTPLPGFLGTDTVSIVVCDEQTPSLCSTSIALVHVGCITPVANSDVAVITNTGVVVNGTTYGGNGLSGALLPVVANDEEQCNSTLALTQINSAPAHGTAVISGGQILYTPSSGYNGPDALQYTICNGCGLCNSTTVSITVSSSGNCTISEQFCTQPFASLELCPQFCGINPTTAGTVTVSVNGAGTVTPNGNGCYTYLTTSVFEGTDIITFSVCDASGNCSTNTTTIEITPSCGGNNPPLAVNDNYVAGPGETLVLNVLDNDLDPDGQPLTITELFTATACGTVAIFGSQLLYTVGDTCTVGDCFQYLICDNGSPALCDTAKVFVEILPPVTNCNYQTDYCTQPMLPVQICVQFCNVPDAAITDANTTFNCSLNILGDTCLQYTPLPGYFGTDIVEIVGCNTAGQCDTAIAYVHVGCTAPNAQDDLATLVNNGTATPVNVLANDSHVCGSPMTPVVLTNPEHGTAAVNPDNAIGYTPQSGYSGIDEFTYLACVACNTGTVCDTAIVVLTILPPELPPLDPQPDAATTLQGTPVTVSVLNNDSGSALDVTEITQPANGTAVLNASNTVTYTPNSGFQGTDTFTYTVCDSGGNCQQETVTITVTPTSVNQPPVAQNDTENTPPNTPITISVLNNDSDPDNTLSQLGLVIIAQPVNGMATVNANGTITYTPDPGFAGTDVFTYNLCDPAGLCDEAIVTVFVTAPLLVDAQPDIEFTTVSTPVTFNILDNDFGEGIEVTQVLVLPQHGDIESLDPVSGQVTYQPEAGYTGQDYFTYQICNSLGVCDVTLVSIAILPDGINQPPTPNNDVAQTPVNTPIDIPVLLNDTDPDNDPLTVTTITNNPDNGTVTINPDGTVTYTPDPGFTGCDVFAYSVCDPSGFCAQAEVGVEVSSSGCQNLPPLAADDEATATEGIPAIIDVLTNDFDPDGSIATLSIGAQPYNGTVSLLPDETGFIYTSNPDFTGTDYFPYIICDNGNPVLCDTAYVTITVEPAPIDAEPDIVYTAQNTPVTFNVFTNDSGTAIELTEVWGGPDNGSIAVVPGTGNVVYTPQTGFTGTDYFEYQICDVAGTCDVTLVTIYVLPPAVTNLPPVAVSDLDTIPANTPTVIQVAQNDYDPFGGDELTVQPNLPLQPQNGTAVINPNGSITYTPNTGFTGTDSLQYIICDNGSPVLCDTATVVIVIGLGQYSNNPPVASDDQSTTEMNTPVVIDILSNDNDPDGDLVAITFISEPAHGQATLNPDNTTTYVPDDNFIGTDYFAYVICDNGSPALCDTAYVSIFVSTDTLKIADTTQQETPVTLCLPDYLSNVNIDTAFVTILPANGGLVLDENCVQYLPDPGFTGIDTLYLQVCTPAQDCFAVGICITVANVNDPPVAVNDTTATDVDVPVLIDVLANDYDPDGDEITAIILLNPPFVDGASVDIDLVNLELDYIPAPGYTGTDSFSYLITDATGLLSDTAWVFITIEDSIVAPQVVVAVNDSASTDVNMPVTIAILGNDTLPQPQPQGLSIDLVSFPSNGSALINTEDNSVTYIPNVNFAGIDTFYYAVCIPDGSGGELCDTALVLINITPNDEDCILLVAEGFSPNGDGVNDLFLVSGIECFSANQPELVIFNRWGDVMYAISNYSNDFAWDGNWQGSNENAPDGTYFYCIDPKTGNKADIKSGFIELHR